MLCDMCGKETKLLRVRIEGTILNVCEGCSKFGSVIGQVEEERFIEKERLKVKEETVDFIIEGYGNLIRKAREKKGLTQKELGEKISEKESVIQKVENEELEPNLKLAKKLEVFLGITLIKEFKEEKKGKKIDFKAENLTIGDLVKLKK